jgi:DNA-binding transcriptional LysR family regulator
MLDLRSLEVFYWVATLSGFRRAAEKLHMTQPAVSARIAQLEEALDCRLLDRSKAGAVLTAKGIELLGYAERMLKLHSEMVMALGPASGVRGTVRLGVSETIVHTWLSDLLKKIHAIYPKVTIEIEVDVSGVLRDQLVSGEVDVALLLGPVSAPRIKNLPICDYPLRCFASPALDLPDRVVTAAELLAHPIITYSRVTRPYLELMERLAGGSARGPRVFANSSLSSIVRMTLDGIGVGVVAEVAIREERHSGRLRLVRTEFDADMPRLSYTASTMDRPDNLLASAVAALAQSTAAAWELEAAPGPA